jgi:hypothetical protein
VDVAGKQSSRRKVGIKEGCNGEHEGHDSFLKADPLHKTPSFIVLMWFNYGFNVSSSPSLLVGCHSRVLRNE